MSNICHYNSARSQPRDLPDAQHVSDLWRGHVYAGAHGEAAEDGITDLYASQLKERRLYLIVLVFGLWKFLDTLLVMFLYITCDVSVLGLLQPCGIKSVVIVEWGKL